MTAPLVLVTDQQGRLGYWYQGQDIPWIGDADRTRLEADGLITTTPAVASSAPARPSQTAPKAAWVDYAVSTGIAKDDAEDLTKQELIA
ncbi:hypothetical protein, partial [Rhodococcus jostii]